MSSPQLANCSLIEQLTRLHDVIGDHDFTIEDVSPEVCARLGYTNPSTLHRTVERVAHEGEILRSSTVEATVTYSWQPIPQFEEMSRRTDDLPLFASIRDMLKDLTDDETTALELLADCDLNMDRSTRIRSASDILNLMKPHERQEFADRMLAGGVFERVGPSDFSPCGGTIWALRPMRLHQVLVRKEELRKQSVKSTMDMLRGQTKELTSSQADILQQTDVASQEIKDLNEEDERLKKQQALIKVRRAEIRADSQTWKAAHKHLQTRKKEIEREHSEIQVQLESLEAQEATKIQEQLDDVLKRIDSLSASQLKELRKRLFPKDD